MTVPELVKQVFGELGGKASLQVLDISPYDPPGPGPLSHKTTWEIRLRDGDRVVSATIPGDQMLSSTLTMKLRAAINMMEQPAS